jgi:hypothetical protein
VPTFHRESENETMNDNNPNDTSGDAPATPPTPEPETTALPSGKLPPELLAWALQDINEEEIRAGLREIQETGGLELRDFIHELEQIVASHD